MCASMLVFDLKDHFFVFINRPGCPHNSLITKELTVKHSCTVVLFIYLASSILMKPASIYISHAYMQDMNKYLYDHHKY